MLHKPPRAHRSSNSKYNESRRAMSVDSGTSDNDKGRLEYSRDKDLCKEDINNKSISSITERVLSPEEPGDEQKSKFKNQN